MKPVLIGLTTLVLGASAAMAQDQSGRFAVFGPSAEREAFFQGQRDQEAERVSNLEEQRREAELALQLAEQEAETQQAAQPQYRRIVRRCFLTEPQEEEVLEPLDEGGSARWRYKVRESNLPGRIVCPRYVFVPGQPWENHVAIQVDDGDVSGRVRIRRPGVNIEIQAD